MVWIPRTIAHNKSDKGHLSMSLAAKSRHEPKATDEVNLPGSNRPQRGRSLHSLRSVEMTPAFGCLLRCMPSLTHQHISPDDASIDPEKERIVDFQDASHIAPQAEAGFMLRDVRERALAIAL